MLRECLRQNRGKGGGGVKRPSIVTAMFFLHFFTAGLQLTMSERE